MGVRAVGADARLSQFLKFAGLAVSRLDQGGNAQEFGIWQVAHGSVGTVAQSWAGVNTGLHTRAAGLTSAEVRLFCKLGTDALLSR